MTTIQPLDVLQREIGSEIDKSFSNFKKHNKDRKTPEYFKNRWEWLDGRVHTFRFNHELMRSDDKYPVEHSYFKENYFEKIIGVVDRYREAMIKEAENMYPGIDVFNPPPNTGGKKEEISNESEKPDDQNMVLEFQLVVPILK